MAFDGSERVRQIARWITSRPPIAYLIAGWIAFVLGSYPGYMSTESVLQLFTVRSGDYSDYAPVMTAIWGALEYVVSGPFPMLALQSGLFLFGTAAILRTVLSPRAAAVASSFVILFPPVFSVLAVIWPDALLAGCLVAAAGAAMQPGRRMKIVAAVLLVVACACRPEAVVAIIPITLLALPRRLWWRDAIVALGVTVAIAGTARLANHLLTVTDTYSWQQQLQMPDLVGTLRRANVKTEAALRAALDGLPLADSSTLVERMTASRDALSPVPLIKGTKRVFEPLASDEQSDALSNAWRAAISKHPGAYLTHRWAMTRALLAFTGKWRPVFDDFGSVALMEPLHHRATSSDWQFGMQHVVRWVAKTPLFRPWLYLLLAVIVIVLARKRPLLRNLAISGLVYELAMFVLAPAGEYRYSHWMIASTCIVIAALAAGRRTSWARSDV
ncbi:MAG: hypothetical protein HOV81_03290 [Kofleriaceae bacterium]|nr:hypothetical protein [Kofleriaceae bacterium]